MGSATYKVIISNDNTYTTKEFSWQAYPFPLKKICYKNRFLGKYHSSF